MASTTYPAVSDAELAAMTTHQTKIYPCLDDGGNVACYRRVTKVPNGWLYGEEFVPETLCCTDCGDPLADGLTLGE